jgi:hypothetical protein
MAASGAASGIANPKPIKGKMKGREPKKSGGAAGWFLFILKVSEYSSLTIRIHLVPGP